MATVAYVVPHPPVLIPEIGQGREMEVKDTISAYESVAQEIAAFQPDTIVIISPHSVVYSDYIHISPGESAYGSFTKFGVPQIRFDVNYDTELVSLLTQKARENNISAGTLGEKEGHLDHGTMVPLYFIQQAYKDFKVVRIGISNLSFQEHYEFGQCLASALSELGRKAVIIASGDLSHRLKDDGPYQFAPEGPEFDQQLTEAIDKAEFLSLLEFDVEFCEAAGECGLRSFIIMAGALDKKAVNSKLYSYQGNFGVGYAVAKLEESGVDVGRNFGEQFQEREEKKLKEAKENEDAYVRLARKSLESIIRDKKELELSPSELESLPKELLEKRAGVFVSLKKQGRLRGCIGTILPTQDTIAAEIIKNAVSAGLSDFRFEPVTVEELPELLISVDVLGEPETIQSMEQLDEKKYGVIVTEGTKGGLLLPNLENVTSVQQQVEIALQKAGIEKKPDESGFTMQRFEVVRHK